MAVTTVGASAPDSVEALKRVKATENEWDTRLNAARRDADETLERMRAEADAALKEAQMEADRDRVARVVQARTETETEAEAIVAEGRKAAERALAGEGRRPADKKDAILDIVLGSFGKD
jgi:vacuolar-type H+-ATPase subunit H